jgi:recombination protein RecT
MSKDLTTTKEIKHSERFLNKVIQEFSTNVDDNLKMSDYQRYLAQGYFIGIDRALKKAEEERLRKNANNRDAKYNNDLAYTWHNVNMDDLALDVVHHARMGLDMMQPNHVSPIPYKNNKMQKYDVGFIKGYEGIKYIALSYALDKPLSVTIELVYSNDEFTPLKKSKDNAFETYTFNIKDAFDRGKVIGGFGYLEYEDKSKNRLIIMTIKDIEKRKPAYASAEFWGGTKKQWENGKQVETQLDGWYEEMCYKTLVRHIYSDKYIARDPKKIDESYQAMIERDRRFNEATIEDEIDENANKIDLDVIDDNKKIIDINQQAKELPSPEEQLKELAGETEEDGPNF